MWKIQVHPFCFLQVAVAKSFWSNALHHLTNNKQRCMDRNWLRTGNIVLKHRYTCEARIRVFAESYLVVEQEKHSTSIHTSLAAHKLRKWSHKKTTFLTNSKSLLKCKTFRRDLVLPVLCCCSYPKRDIERELHGRFTHYGPLCSIEH